MKKKAAKGSTRKHASKKHHATRGKHHPAIDPGGPMIHVGQHVHTVAKHPHHAKPRHWSPDGDVALCSARAVAESLRLALGAAVSDDDVEALYWRTASDADAGQSIWDALRAAQDYGLGGFRPQLIGPPMSGARLILGLALPEGPHAICADGGRWWSWGEPYDRAAFPGAIIEEAWAVTW